MTESNVSKKLPQKIAGGFFRLISHWAKPGLLGGLTRGFLKLALTPMLRTFVAVDKEGPQRFWGLWMNTLPMDNQTLDELIPTRFTEMWLPIEKTQEGLILCVYSNEGAFQAVQVVDVRSDAPDAGIETVGIGAWLAPLTSVAITARPFAARGYVYQHDHGAVPNNDPFKDRLLVLQEPSNTNAIDVFWREPDAFGIEWPFEYRRYTVNGVAQPPVAIIFPSTLKSTDEM